MYFPFYPKSQLDIQVKERINIKASDGLFIYIYIEVRRIIEKVWEIKALSPKFLLMWEEKIKTITTTNESLNPDDKSNNDAVSIFSWSESRFHSTKIFP